MSPLAEIGASGAPERIGSSARASARRPARASAESFERLYAASPDPWRYDSSEYEREKYAATLAALDGRSYRRALEAGCSIGAFTELLADRCAALTALDFSARALDLARRRLRGRANVEIVEASFPEQAPAGRWDLVVCAEVLYYLDPPALEQATEWLRERLLEGATVLTVDWRGSTTTEPHDGNEVHELLRERLADWHALEGRQPGYRLDRFDGDGR
ncbi:MAG TPA: SAM-dependent methyltransferase [Solirubrobacteraceae bacterium]|jgi:SAM-dependent methyltransferase